MMDTQELLRQQRKVKEEQAEFQRMRAVEGQKDTIQNLEKKEKDKKKAKRLQEDKYMDNR